MKKFLSKYKWRILYWLIFLTILFYLAPKQSDYYLDSDIEYFKSRYLLIVSIWIGIIISLLWLVASLVITKSIKQSLQFFLYRIVTTAFFLFIFHNQVLAGALFINRQFNRGTIQKTYEAAYMVGEEQIKKNFFPYDVATKSISSDPKLIDRIYKPGLKPFDRLTIQLNKGLFGIAYLPQPIEQ